MLGSTPLEWELISTVETEGGIVDLNYSLAASQKGHSEDGHIGFFAVNHCIWSGYA